MELLIVIGVLGILAAGLLAAIDPFEQLRKARDTNTRNSAIELLNATQRYYASHTAMPWNVTSITDCGWVNGAESATNDWKALRADVTESSFSTGKVVVKVAREGTPDNVAGVNSCLKTTLITNDSELKDTFFTSIQNVLYLGSGGPSRSVVCFSPESKSEKSKEDTKYCLNGTGNMTDSTTTCATATVKFQCFM